MLDKCKITFKKVKCPNCDNSINYFRIPKNFKQFLWGGYTCENCGTEIDKYGKIIKKG
jgi:uncharacterized protein (DUF983 family)